MILIVELYNKTRLSALQEGGFCCFLRINASEKAGITTNINLFCKPTVDDTPNIPGEFGMGHKK